MTLTQGVIEQDHELEESATKSNDALVRHRWHWTLDESNDERVSIREYARVIERNYTTVHAQVNGYASWLIGPDRSPLNEAVARAKVGAEKEAVIEAVAEARGISFKHARESRANEVRHVRNLAREAAERKGTSVEAEAPKIAQMAARIDEAEIRVRDQREAARTLRYVEMVGYLHAAMRSLRKAASVTGRWDGEEQELLAATLNQVRELIALVDARIVGKPAIDWDAELEAIMAGVSE